MRIINSNKALFKIAFNKFDYIQYYMQLRTFVQKIKILKHICTILKMPYIPKKIINVVLLL